MDKNIFNYWISISRFQLLILSFSPFLLGASVNYYLGNRFDSLLFFQGLFFIWFLQMGAHYLYAIFSPIESINKLDIKRKKFFGKKQLIFLSVAMFIGATLIFYNWFSLSISISLIGFHSALLLIGIILLVVFPFSLIKSGFGELIVSFLITLIIPSFSFTLQSGDVHRLIGFSGIPLFFVFLSTMLSFQFQSYKLKPTQGSGNLLQKLKWEDGMLWNEMLLAIAYVVIIIGIRMGLPIRIGLPIFLTIPFSVGLV
jgi:1,4-dihydroxy-2-naphthoate octaprenyltransferase